MEPSLKKHTTLICFAMFIIAMPLAWLTLNPLIRQFDDVWADVVRYLVTVAITILLMRLIWKKNVFSFKCPKLFKGLFTFGLVGLVGAVGAFVFSYEMVDVMPAIEMIVGVVLMNLAIAISEEFLFRGVILNVLLKAYSEKKKSIHSAVLVSCAIFGLRHFLNLITKPDALIMTCAQAAFTFMAGTYLCAVYLRTKNIWVCVLIHFLEDFAVSLWPLFSSVAASSASTDITVSNALGMVILLIPYIVFAWFMLRDKKWQLSLLSELRT